MTNFPDRPFRVTSVIASQTSSGIGPVCRYAAVGMARNPGWDVTLLCLHDAEGLYIDPDSGLKTVGLGLQENCPSRLLEWLSSHPQDVVVTSDVSFIEPAFPYLPAETVHVIQIHDSGRRYREVAVRHAQWIDGVTCVGAHIEAVLRRELDAVGYKGLLRTVPNGACFPPSNSRDPHDGPLRLLFLGRVEPFKGVFDFVPLLKHLKQMAVPVKLHIVGGDNPRLRHRIKNAGLGHLVTWGGGGFA